MIIQTVNIKSTGTLEQRAESSKAELNSDTELLRADSQEIKDILHSPHDLQQHQASYDSDLGKLDQVDQNVNRIEQKLSRNQP